MATPTKPETTKEAVDQLWYAIIGSNGDGMAERLRRVEKKFEEHEGKAVHKGNPRRLEILGLVIAGLVFLQTIGLFDGIRIAIFNWLSGGGA
jgi:hypothetical protein